MIAIYGKYRWFPRNVAFRKDYCLHCNQETMALAERALEVMHFFWIPFLPLGFWRRWFCSECGWAPGHPPRTRKPFKWAVVGLLGVAAATFWLAPLKSWDPEMDIAFIWTARLGTLVGIPVLVWSILSSPMDVSYRSARESIEPYREPTCPFCLGPLTLRVEWRCDECDLERA